MVQTILSADIALLMLCVFFFSSRRRHPSSLCDWSSDVCSSDLLKNGDWLLVYRQNTSDAFSDFNRALKIALIIILLGIIATITLAFIRFKNMFKRSEERRVGKEGRARWSPER